MNAVRLAPSGPDIANAGGAPLAPGPGSTLRLVEAAEPVDPSHSTFGTVPVPISVSLGQAPTLALELDSPHPGANYRATVLVEVHNLTTSYQGHADLFLDIGIGTDPTTAVWTTAATNTHLCHSTYDASFAPPQGLSRLIRCDLPLTLGSALGVTAGTPSIFLRARISAEDENALAIDSEATDAKGVGTLLMQLWECF